MLQDEATGQEQTETPEEQTPNATEAPEQETENMTPGNETPMEENETETETPTETETEPTVENETDNETETVPGTQDTESTVDLSSSGDMIAAEASYTSEQPYREVEDVQQNGSQVTFTLELVPEDQESTGQQIYNFGEQIELEPGNYTATAQLIAYNQTVEQDTEEITIG